MRNKPSVAWALVAGIVLCILAMSSIPAGAMPEAPQLWRWDKLIHGLEYGVLGAALFRAIRLSSLHPAARYWIVLCVLTCAGFAVLDELYQSTTPGRDSSGYDVLADIVGATFATLLSAVFYYRRRPQVERTSRVDHS